MNAARAIIPETFLFELAEACAKRVHAAVLKK